MKMFLQNEPHTNGLQNKNFQNWPLREWFTEHKSQSLPLKINHIRIYSYIKQNYTIKDREV